MHLVPFLTSVQRRSSTRVHLLLNAVAASAASGLTYIRNIVPQLRRRDDIKATVLTSAFLRNEFDDSANLQFHVVAEGHSAPRRFWFEQRALPKIIRDLKADLLISAGNFALHKSPVPQILLSGNSLYCSRDFSQDLLRRHEYRAWIDLRVRALLARRSIHWANRTVAPSAAFARELQAWSGREVTAIHHGFDPQLFAADSEPLSPETGRKLSQANGALRLLYVSHYNYFRNFETLFRALPLIKQKLVNQKVKLLLTCELKAGADSSSYNPTSAAALVRELGVENDIVQLGILPYRFLHCVYKSSDIYVTPSYAESFAHPTVEAMSCALPIVASDLPVHREICQDAAVFFPRFSPERLADHVCEIAQSPRQSAAMSARGTRRALDFSWEKHVNQLIALARGLHVGGAACSTSLSGASL